MIKKQRKGGSSQIANPGPTLTFKDETARLALEGDVEAARTVLREFIEAARLSRGRAPVVQIDRTYAEYIADAFDMILATNAADARLALGIKSSKPGRRKGVVTHDPKAIAACFYLLVRRGLTKTNARRELESVADERTIRNAIREWRAFGDPGSIDDELLKALAIHQEKGRPRPETIHEILARNGKRK